MENACFLAKIGADTAENEQHFAEILPIVGPTTAVRGARSDALASPAGTPQFSRTGQHSARDHGSAERFASWLVYGVRLAKLAK